MRHAGIGGLAWASVRECHPSAQGCLAGFASIYRADMSGRQDGLPVDGHDAAVVCGRAVVERSVLHLDCDRKAQRNQGGN
jgi:hypothetical protein